MATVYTTDQIIAAMRDFETSINKHMESPHPCYSTGFANKMRTWVKYLISELKAGNGVASKLLDEWSSNEPDEFVEFMDGVILKLTGGTGTGDEINGFWAALK